MSRKPPYVDPLTVAKAIRRKVRGRPPKEPAPEPIPMRLHCPSCHNLHVDGGAFAHKPHHTHACQVCGNVWRPAVVPTVGVRFLPGFRDHAADLYNGGRVETINAIYGKLGRPQ